MTIMSRYERLKVLKNRMEEIKPIKKGIDFAGTKKTAIKFFLASFTLFAYLFYYDMKSFWIMISVFIAGVSFLALYESWYFGLKYKPYSSLFLSEKHFKKLKYLTESNLDKLEIHYSYWLSKSTEEELEELLSLTKEEIDSIIKEDIVNEMKKRIDKKAK